MGFLSVIRRWALRDKMPIREIARRTGLSRNTIRKYLREGAVEPQFKTPKRPSRLDPYADRLSAWLLIQTRKSRKERRTIKQMHADLVKLGYDGSYERVAAFARAWREDRHQAEQTTGRGTYVPLVFAPGEAFQFDWSEDWANIGGERVKLQVAHIKLSHSRAFLVRAYPLQTHEMLFDAHWHAFRIFGGVPGRGIYDNMKTAVDRVGKGKQRDVNARFKAMASHYVFEPEFCNPAAGWEKGQVEKNVQDARNRMWQVMPVFADLAELNQWLEERCIALWAETPHKALPGSIADVWEAEQPTLMALPPAFDGFIEHSKRVSPTCLITFERNRYSVPASFANRRVSLHVYPERLVVVAEGQMVCEHARIIERSHRKPGKVIYDWRHYLAVIQRKPGALRNGAPFTKMPDAFRQLQDHMLRKEGGDREMVDILSLVLQHNEEDVLCAVELALEAGVPTKTHILNLLHRLIDRRPTDRPEVDPPDALALQTTPEANVSRYDGLRQTEEKRHAS
ncbi:IS21 family transposase [Sulfitobacter sp. 1A16808]|uniref:IS21 family transposase n=1 Tax=Sulfitobacter sp. 1A16808 TaxID=3368572 RepID=UPI003744FDF1